MRDKSWNPWLNSNPRQDVSFPFCIRSFWCIFTTLAISPLQNADTLKKKRDENVQQDRLSKSFCPLPPESWWWGPQDLGLGPLSPSPAMNTESLWPLARKVNKFRPRWMQWNTLQGEAFCRAPLLPPSSCLLNQAQAGPRAAPAGGHRRSAGPTCHHRWETCSPDDPASTDPLARVPFSRQPGRDSLHPARPRAFTPCPSVVLGDRPRSPRVCFRGERLLRFPRYCRIATPSIWQELILIYRG